MKSLRTLSIVLVAAGVILGTSLFGLIAWGDTEAALYDSMGSAEKPLSSLRCPVALHPNETGQVRASFRNDSDRPVSVLVYTHITAGSVILVHKHEDYLRLEPGETVTLEFPVSGQDRVYGRVVMVRMHQFRSVPLPSRDGSCGILVLDLAGLSGRAAVALIMSVSLALTGAGILLWERAPHPRKERARYAASAMRGLGVVQVAGMLSALLNFWLAGLLLTLLTMLLIGVVLAEFLQG